MAKSFKRYARESINSILGLVGAEVVARHSWSEPRTFIPFRQTLAGAQKASLSVSDYIDLKHNVPGATQETIDRIADLGVFDGQIERVCEIGPGSGRYLEKTLRACNPSYYEIYETATEWANGSCRHIMSTYSPRMG